AAQRFRPPRLCRDGPRRAAITRGPPGPAALRPDQPQGPPLTVLRHEPVGCPYRRPPPASGFLRRDASFQGHRLPRRLDPHAAAGGPPALPVPHPRPGLRLARTKETRRVPRGLFQRRVRPASTHRLWRRVRRRPAPARLVRELTPRSLGAPPRGQVRDFLAT